MIRGIFFDLFGTLLIYGNMKKAWANWLDQFYDSLRRHGLSLSKTDFSKACDGFISKDEPESSEQNLTVLEKRIKTLCSSLELFIDDEAIASTADLVASKWQQEITLDPDSLPVLEKLKESKKLALVSNFDHPRYARKLLSKYGLDTFFDSIIISGEIGIKKPDPGIFTPALSSLELESREVAYVGDTEEDMEVALLAKMVPIKIIRKNKASNEDQFDFEIDPQKIDNVSGKVENQYRAICDLRELLFV